MVLRDFVILALGVLLIAWVVQARHNLRKLSSFPNGPRSNGEHKRVSRLSRHHRHRHPTHLRHEASLISTEELANSNDRKDAHYDGEEDNWKGENRQLPLLNRLLLKTRETNEEEPYRRRRSGKLYSLLSESSASGLDLMPDDRKRKLADALWNHVRGKRHYSRRTWTADDLKSFNDSRLKLAQFESESTYEVEVREAQNSSLCNYTVIPILDPGGRIPRELEHIKCNHAGSRCQDKGTYCCIQTYRNVEVVYVDGKKEAVKVYSGCVCALQSYGTLEPYAPDVNIND